MATWSFLTPYTAITHTVVSDLPRVDAHVVEAKAARIGLLVVVSLCLLDVGDTRAVLTISSMAQTQKLRHFAAALSVPHHHRHQRIVDRFRRFQAREVGHGSLQRGR